MELREYLDRGVSPFHVVKTVTDRLREEGFEEIKYGDQKELKVGQGYFVSPFPTMACAFFVNPKGSGLHIGLAHTDSPSFLLKPNPEMPEEPYLRVNVEPYGGMLKRTWFDRPLGLAGRVCLKNDEDVFNPKEVLFDSVEPWFVIPSLAPHLDHEIETSKIDVQKVLVPLYGIGEGGSGDAGSGENGLGEAGSEDAGSGKNGLDEVCSGDAGSGKNAGDLMGRSTSVKSLIDAVSKRLNVRAEDILSYSLYLYNADKTEGVGVNSDFVLAPRIDNIASVAALTEGIISASGSVGGCSVVSDENLSGGVTKGDAVESNQAAKGCAAQNAVGEILSGNHRVSMVAFFDNEEIGSRSKQGADSELLKMVVRDIYKRIGHEDELHKELLGSVMLSVDGAHGVHPNYTEKSDPTAQVVLGGGVVLKSSATQRYVTDGRATAIVKGICEKNGIRVQEQANRSGAPGGQTLGPIASSFLPITAADIGIPMLAMHSAREVATNADYIELEKLAQAFLS